MENEKILGIVLLIFGLLVFVLYIIPKIKMFIRTKKVKFKETTGLVVRSINTLDDEYQNMQKEKYFNKYKSTKNIYESLNRILPDSIENHTSNDSSYASVIEYEVDGEKYEIISSFSSDKKESINKRYKIKYNPNDPCDSFIVNDRGKIVIVFSILLIGIGLVLYLK